MTAGGAVTRSGLLKGVLVGGAALAVGAGTASAAPGERDLAWLRFGITVEYVSAAYYLRARRAGGWTDRERRALERATAAEVAHRNAFRAKLLALGEPAIEPEDIEIELPDAAFASRTATITLGRRLESLTQSAYLGAVSGIADPDLRRLFAQVCAAEAQQLAYLTGLGGRALTDPFPPVHGIETASEALATWLP
ncbi:MAG: ferritin-like domain-containing protein [Thermoleophilia bacterium]